MKKIMLLPLALIGILLVIPLVFQALHPAKEIEVEGNHISELKVVDQELVITIFRYEKNEYQQLPLEEYLIGVVAAEMPASFELEALKAQAIAARTYALKILETETYLLDTVIHQVYQDTEQLKEKWQADFDKYYHRIRQAVQATTGLVMKYEGDLILPLFFAMSSGRTENSEDYFITNLPFLRSVASEWDKSARNFEAQKSFGLYELQNIFDKDYLNSSNIKILSKTEGGNVHQVLIGDQIYTGREVREILNLRSSSFSFEFTDNMIHITTYGHGHGVGMSQNGANELAKKGKDHFEILNHYYHNIKIIEKNSLN